MENFKTAQTDFGKTNQGYGSALLVIFGILLLIGMFNLYSAACGN